MKLVVNDYVIDIKVKKKHQQRCSLLETMYFLNNCTIAFSNAAKYMTATMPSCAKEFEKMGSDIYAALKAAGAYKDI